MNDNRVNYRRYEDRRIALLLALHEILFDEAPSVERDRRLLLAVLENYRVDRAAFVTLESDAGMGTLAATAGDWPPGTTSASVAGSGFGQLVRLHEETDGALTLEMVRKPERFSPEVWNNLWDAGVGAPARALLSLPIVPRRGPRRLLWLQQIRSSREWSSRDRDLAEAVGSLLTRAIDKGA